MKKPRQAEADDISLEPVERGVGPTLRPADLPEDFRLLTELPDNHPARRYPRKRGLPCRGRRR